MACRHRRGCRQSQTKQRQAYVACRCRRGCRRSQTKQRQAYVACRRCRRGCRQSQTNPRQTTTSLHGLLSSLCVTQGRDDEPTWLVGVVVLKKRMKKPTLSRNCKRGGGLSLLSWVQTEADDDDEPTWLVVVIVVRCLKEKDPPRLTIASEGAGGLKFRIGRNPPRLAVACKGVGFCHLYCTVIVSNQ